MELADIKEALEDNSKAAQFIVDNFDNVQLVGCGTFSVVFRANSTRFHPVVQTFALKVILALEGLSEADVRKIYAQEMLSEKVLSKRRKGMAMFVQTYDIVYMQTALIQIKDFHSHSLKKINMQDFREFKVKALIKAILAAE